MVDVELAPHYTTHDESTSFEYHCLKGADTQASLKTEVEDVCEILKANTEFQSGLLEMSTEAPVEL